MRLGILCRLLLAIVSTAGYGQVPEYAITPQQSMIKFHVKSGYRQGRALSFMRPWL